VSAVEEVDMLEEHPRALTVVDRSVELYFRPFEIKTLRVRHLPL
jgi:alpha-mannosidase